MRNSEKNIPLPTLFLFYLNFNDYYLKLSLVSLDDNAQIFDLSMQVTAFYLDDFSSF